MEKALGSFFFLLRSIDFLKTPRPLFCAVPQVQGANQFAFGGAGGGSDGDGMEEMTAADEVARAHHTPRQMGMSATPTVIIGANSNKHTRQGLRGTDWWGHNMADSKSSSSSSNFLNAVSLPPPPPPPHFPLSPPPFPPVSPRCHHPSYR